MLRLRILARSLGMLGMLGVLGAATAARAQSSAIVAEGRRLYESGNLGGALDRLTAAEARDDLTRDNLIELLETRVLIHRVQGDQDGLIADLRTLVAIAPERPASEEFPPEVRNQMTRMRASAGRRIEVRSEVSETDEGVVARAEVVTDAARVARTARVHVRQAGDAAFRSSDRPLTLRDVHGVVEHYAEAIGPGGVVVARDGTSDAPLTFALSPTPRTMATEAEARARGRGSARGSASPSSRSSSPSWSWWRRVAGRRHASPARSRRRGCHNRPMGPPAKPVRDAAQTWPPDVVGRYRLCFQLARGGMATVYLARAEGPGGFSKLFAVKVIHPHLSDQRQFVEMFLDEARLASRIEHRNVCQVFDFGAADGIYYLAMEHVRGETLSAIQRHAAEIPRRSTRSIHGSSLVVSRTRRAASTRRTRRATTRAGSSSSSTATSRRRTSWSATTAASASSTSASRGRSGARRIRATTS